MNSHGRMNGIFYQLNLPFFGSCLDMYIKEWFNKIKIQTYELSYCMNKSNFPRTITTISFVTNIEKQTLDYILNLLSTSPNHH